MAYLSFFPRLLRPVGRLLFLLDGKRQWRRHRFPVRPQLEALETRIVPTTYTLPLVNQTGLNPAQESIYVLGFSTASQMALQSNGQFASLASGPAAGTIQSYNISTLQSITLNSATPLIGARLYFFVEPSNQAAPTFTYSNNIRLRFHRPATSRHPGNDQNGR